MEISIGQVLRYKKPINHENLIEDGYTNFHYLVHKASVKKLLLEKGINQSASIRTSNKQHVRPAILISSSPNKKGSAETPWEDYYDVDNGHIRYYGDNKLTEKSPESAPGNKALLEAFQLAHSHDPLERQKTPPILFFKRETINGVAKGYPKFMGVGVIDSIELVTQWDNSKQTTFTNYAFDFTVLNLQKENELFEWEWINQRREVGFSLKGTNLLAPASWQIWLKKGNDALANLRRRVSTLRLVKAVDQKPKHNTEQDITLKFIYKYYDGKKHKFEALAEEIAAKVLDEEYGIYTRGWVTRGSSDGGADFVGKVTLGSGFSSCDLIVIGQAKCEGLNTPTGGNHIARTVARLKRGWLGVYVTTSYFSESVQREVIEDKYPIVLIHGKRLAEEVNKIIYESNQFSSVSEYLSSLELNYPNRIKQRNPEEILY